MIRGISFANLKNAPLIGSPKYYFSIISNINIEKNKIYYSIIFQEIINRVSFIWAGAALKPF